MWLFSVLLVASHCVESLLIRGFGSRSTASHLSPLYSIKHKGKVGAFIENLPSIIPKPTALTAEKKEIIERLAPILNEMDEEKAGQKTNRRGTAGARGEGALLRRSRLRNLKEAKVQSDSVVNVPPPPVMPRKWGPEEVANVVKCLNLSYGNRKREELNDKQRLGIIDWAEFDLHAEQIIPGYNQEGNTKVRSRVFSWVTFHIQKRDIRFNWDKWLWDPKPKGVRRQVWKKKLVAFKVEEKKELKRQENAEYTGEDDEDE